MSHANSKKGGKGYKGPRVDRRSTGEGSRPVASTGGIEGLPVLRSASGSEYTAESTFAEFTRKLEDYCRRNFGLIADIFKNGEYPNIAEVEYDPARMDANVDPFGIYRDTIKKKISIREDQLAELEANKSRVFAVIRGQLSVDLLESIKQRDGWGEAADRNDALALWRLVVMAHLVAGTDDEAELRFVARLRYSQLRQQANESTASFRLRFDARIHAMNTVGQDPPNQEDQARDFLGKLDMERYGTMLREYRNNMHERVEDLDAAYNFAANYIVTRRVSSGNLVLVNTAEPVSQK